MNNVKLDALLVRAFKTFVQGAASALALNITTITDLNGGKVVLIGAVAAGISALMNLFLNPQEAK